jgi:predicted NACHT family NTPase
MTSVRLRSLAATEANIALAKQALVGKKWTQEHLANQLKITRSTVSNFFRGKPIDRKNFISICQILEITVEEISSQKESLTYPNPQLIDKDNLVDIDRLVQIARNCCMNDILKRCGTMRVLDMEQPISLIEIYTDVNVLEKLAHNQRKEIGRLLERFRVEDFYRWGLAGVKQKRISGIDAIYQHSKLILLGKPGAGKTTFLKFLATACINGELFADRVPIFVTLKDFSDSNKNCSLLQFLTEEFSQWGVELEPILKSGRAFLFLDGLDEVSAEYDERILREIRLFAQRYNQIQIVITCRIAAKQYIFEQFTEVEIADFDEQQIITFAGNWFLHKQVKSEDFLSELNKYRGVKELATSPLLLTLLCLAFEESGSFPSNRAELYKEGLDALLRKWDSKRGIRRDSVYKDLSVQKKEDLLSQVALTTFENGDYFVKQSYLEDYICDYIRNTANAKIDDEELHLDSESVLKSIEAQHGLFVERARGIYSFSHLTFHEYFAARQIVVSTSPSKLEAALQKLVSHLTDKRWHEVIILSVGMSRKADDLLILIKKEIDKLLQDDEKLQDFLVWADEKSKSVNTSYKLVAVRAYYFANDCILVLDLPRDLDHNLALALDSSLDFAINQSVDSILDLDDDLACDRTLALALALDRTLTHDSDLNIIDLDLERIRTHDHSRSILDDNTLALTFARLVICSLSKEISDNNLYQRLQTLKRQLIDPEKDWGGFISWWKLNGKKWILECRQLMIKYRNIGHNWQFTDDQKEKLSQYYEATKLLVECLNSDCYLSRETRKQIEDSLLLPIKTCRE